VGELQPRSICRAVSRLEYVSAGIQFPSPTPRKPFTVSHLSFSPDIKHNPKRAVVFPREIVGNYFLAKEEP
jgi:hypothetical protein